MSAYWIGPICAALCAGTNIGEEHDDCVICDEIWKEKQPPHPHQQAPHVEEPFIEDTEPLDPDFPLASVINEEIKTTLSKTITSPHTSSAPANPACGGPSFCGGACGGAAPACGG